MDSNGATWAGGKLLNEVEETSLEEVLHALRQILPTIGANGDNDKDAATGNTAASNKLQAFPIPLLNDILGQHFRATRGTVLAVSGSYLPFLYALVATLVLPPRGKAVLVIDMHGKFRLTGLNGCSPFARPAETDAPTDLAPDANDLIPCLRPDPITRVRPQDLEHVHIYQPAWDAKVEDIMAEAERFMLYGNHASKDREWWGTVIIHEVPRFAGDATPSTTTASLRSRPIVNAGYRGWLRIKKEPVCPPLNLSLPAEDLPGELARYNAAVGQTGWLATSDWGGFLFRLQPR